MRLSQALDWVLLLLFAPPAVQSAWAATQQISWAEFSTRVMSGHTIRMVLPDGTHIEGRPLQVKPDSIDIRVTRTSNKQAHPKGAATIPRGSVSVVQVRSPRWKGKLIGTLAPIAAGAAILSAGFGRGGDQIYELIAVGGVVIGAGAPCGFFVGRAIDRRFEEFVIVPER